MRNVITLLLVVTLCFVSAVPASASEKGDFDLINVLDYCTPNDSGEYLVFLDAGEDDVLFSGDPAFRAYDINLLCYITGTFTGVKFISSGGVQFNLNYTKVAYNLYRISGYVQGYSIENSIIRFTHSANISVEFLSYYINPVYADIVAELGTFYLETHGFSPTINYNPADTINGRTWTANEDYRNAYLSVQGNVNNWHLYDYLDLQFAFACSGINSISVMFGSETVPFQSSIVLDAGLSVTEHIVTIRVDVRGLDRSSEFYPIIRIEANCSPGLENAFNVLSVSGVLDVDSVNPIAFWFQKLFHQNESNQSVIVRWLSYIWESLSGDTTPGNEFTDDMVDKNEELGNIADSIGSVSKPNIDSINPSVNITNTGANIAGGVGPVLTSIMTSDSFSPLILMVLTFALIAYVLYGKS